VIENAIATSVGGTNITGIGVGSPSYYQSGDRVRVLGSVAFDIHDWGFFISGDTVRFVDTSISDSVVIGPGDNAAYQRAGANLTLDRVTFAGWGNYGFVLEVDGTEPKDPDFAIGAAITHSIFDGGPTGLYAVPTGYLSAYTHDHNDLWNIATPNTGFSS